MSDRDVVERMRGPEGGYARAHAGLAAFWRQVEREVLPRPVPAEDQALFEALDAGSRREQQGAAPRLGRGEALRAPLAMGGVGRRAGGGGGVLRAGEPELWSRDPARDQKVLFGLYATTKSMWRCNARTPLELKSAIATGLENVSFIVPQTDVEEEEDEDEDAEDPAVLLVVDGLERCADPAPTERVLYLDDTGESVRILVSVGATSPSDDASAWRERERWAEEDTTVFEVPAAPAPAEEAVTRARGALDSAGANGPLAARALDALSAVLAPVSREDLTVGLGLPAAALHALEVAPPAARDLVVVEPDGTYRLHDDAVRARWAASVDTGAIEDALVARGLSALASASRPRTAGAWPGYLVEYLGAHMVRRGAAPADLMRLVSPAWLDIWMRRPGALVGFVEDVYRARLSAEGALRSATTEVERRAPLHDVVWCAVVTESLLAKEGSRDADRDTAQPTGRSRWISRGRRARRELARRRCVYWPGSFRGPSTIR